MAFEKELLLFSKIILGRAETTQQSYVEQVRLFLVHCSKHSAACVSEITNDIVISWLQLAEYSPYTFNFKVSVLRSFFRALNMSVPLPMNKRVDRCDFKCRTEHEIKRIFSMCQNRKQKVILALLYACGLRASELCGIKLHDIDLEEGTIRIHGKGNKTRVVGVFGEAHEMLSKYIRISIPKRRYKSEYLLTNKRSTSITRQSVFYIIKRMGKRAGIPELSPHQLRHSFATHFLNNGGDVYMLSKAMGHSDIDVTERYLHSSSAHVRKNIADHFPTHNLSGSV